jgi:hypothetical protein
MPWGALGKIARTPGEYTDTHWFREAIQRKWHRSGSVRGNSLPALQRGPDTEVQTPKRSQEVQTPMILVIPGGPDTHDPRGPDTHDPRDPRETRRIEIAPRGWSFSVAYSTRKSDLILVSITVVVDMTKAANARRCFRSVSDAHIRQGPDRR